MSGESYDLHLTTLSPIHIGSGKSYSCCEFVPAKAKSKGQIVKIIKRVNLTNYYTSVLIIAVLILLTRFKNISKPLINCIFQVPQLKELLEQLSFMTC